MKPKKETPNILLSCTDKREPMIQMLNADIFDMIVVYVKLTAGMFKFMQAYGLDTHMAAGISIYANDVARSAIFGAGRIKRRRIKAEALAISYIIGKRYAEGENK